MDTGVGHIQFHKRDKTAPITYTLHSYNGLWYNDNHGAIMQDIKDTEYSPTIHRLTQAAQYELYHQRFGHPGERIMSTLHHHIDDVPPLHGNAFYKCISCIRAKCRHRAMNVTPLPYKQPKWWQDDWTTIVEQRY